MVGGASAGGAARGGCRLGDGGDLEQRAVGDGFCGG